MRRIAEVVLCDDDGNRNEINYKQEASDGFDLTHTRGYGEAITGFATGSRTTPEP